MSEVKLEQLSVKHQSTVVLEEYCSNGLENMEPVCSVIFLIFSVRVCACVSVSLWQHRYTPLFKITNFFSERSHSLEWKEKTTKCQKRGQTTVSDVWCSNIIITVFFILTSANGTTYAFLSTLIFSSIMSYWSFKYVIFGHSISNTGLFLPFLWCVYICWLLCRAEKEKRIDAENVHRFLTFLHNYKLWLGKATWHERHKDSRRCTNLWDGEILSNNKRQSLWNNKGNKNTHVGWSHLVNSLLNLHFSLFLYWSVRA